MATIHQASLAPSKLELLETYLPTLAPLAPYLDPQLTQIGAYRFDDPAGEVGIETHILSTGGGTLLQIPLTYRNEPLEGGEQWYVGTMEHSVLGTRWVYNGCGDAVYVGEVVRAILTGGTEAAELVQTPDGPVARQPTVNVKGSGISGVDVPDLADPSPQLVGNEVHTSLGDGRSLLLRMVLSGDVESSDALVLTGTWSGSPGPTTLALIVEGRS